MTRAQAFGVAALALGLVFAFDAALVASGLTQRVDRAILTALRQIDLPGVAISPHWTVTLALWLTSLGGSDVRAPLTILAALGFVLLRRRADAILLVGAVGSGAVALPLLKAVFDRARPDPPWRLAVEHDLSFPSGHAMGSMLLYPLLGLLIAGRGGGLAGIAVALAVGLTRVFLGVHWASDVIGGWAIGAAWGCAALGIVSRVSGLGARPPGTLGSR